MGVALHMRKLPLSIFNKQMHLRRRDNNPLVTTHIGNIVL